MGRERARETDRQRLKEKEEEKNEKEGTGNRKGGKRREWTSGSFWGPWGSSSQAVYEFGKYWNRLGQGQGRTEQGFCLPPAAKTIGLAGRHRLVETGSPFTVFVFANVLILSVYVNSVNLFLSAAFNV